MLLRFRLPLRFCHGYTCFVELAVETLFHLQGELSAKALCHFFDASRKLVFPCRLAVWVCSHRAFRCNGSMGNIVPFSLKERVMVKGNGKAIAFGNGGGLNKLLLDTLSDFLSRLLLQDYEVTADLCACILAEHT